MILGFWGSDEVDHLAVVAPVDAEVLAIDGEDLAARLTLGQNDNRGVGEIHLVVARHERAETGPVGVDHELDAENAAFEQLEQGIDVHVVGTEEVRDFRQNRLGGEHGGTHLLHQCDGPGVIRVVAVEIGYEGSRVADGDHDRVNLRRLLVAGSRLPATQPARSEVIS